MDVRVIDLLDGDFYVDDPYAAYRWMRESAPVYWDAINELWGVSRYDDIVDVERRKDVFVNSDQAKGGYRPNIPADPAIIGLDDPLHHQRRNLVSRRFTPRAVGAREEHVRDDRAAPGRRGRGGRRHRRDRRRARRSPAGHDHRLAARASPRSAGPT